MSRKAILLADEYYQKVQREDMRVYDALRACALAVEQRCIAEVMRERALTKDRLTLTALARLAKSLEEGT